MGVLTKYPRKSPDTASRIIDGEAVIVLPQEGLARILNPSGSRIWELLDGNRTAGGIAETISGEFGISKQQACADVCSFLRELENKKMVLISDEPAGR
jgi:hypothetical protein